MGLHQRAIVFSAFVIGALAPAVPAGAATGFTLVDGTLTGTSGNDILVLGNNGTDQTNNRFAAGDSGFASQFDFDPAADGEQRRTMDQFVPIDLSGGDDIIRFDGTWPAGNALVGFTEGGPGNDTVDFGGIQRFEENNTLALGGSTGLFNAVNFETVLGSPRRDSINVSASGWSSVTTVSAGADPDNVAGGDKNESFDLGTGSDSLNAGGGNDVIIMRTPIPTNEIGFGVNGGDGNDVLTIAGTDGPDGVAFIANDYGRAVPRVQNIDGAKLSGNSLPNLEQIILDLGSGDDDLYVEPLAAPLTAHGGGGNDGLLFDAARFAASSDAAHVAVGGLGMLTHDGFEDAFVDNEWFVATGTGPGGGPHVRTFNAAMHPDANFYAYAANFSGGVNVATGDLDGDGVDEIVTAPAGNGGPHVRIFDRFGEPIGPGFYAYTPEFMGGVNIATGDFDHDGIDDIVTAPASEGGPHVKVFNMAGGLRREWFAKGFRPGGLNVAVSGLDHDVVIGSGPGSPSRLSTFNWIGGETTTAIRPFESFGGGVRVAGFEPISAPGQRNGIAVAAGPGGAPHVRTFTHTGTGPLTPVGSFYAFGESFSGGVSLSSGALQAGSPSPLIVGAGAGGAPHVRQVSPTGVAGPISFYAYGENFPGGVRVAVSGPRGFPLG